MKDPQKHTTLEGPAALAGTLLETLQQEQEALTLMGEHLAHQLEAVRTPALEALEQATFEVNESAAALDRLRQTRTRQMRLLGRVLHLEAATLEDTAAALDDQGSVLGRHLLEARAQIHAQVNRTRTLFLELDFLLRYAMHLGHATAQALQELAMAPPTHVYTASGATARTTHPRSFVNKVG
jgi:hypothetical protein